MEPIAPFRNHLPVRIRFGEGVLGELGDVLAMEGATRPFVVIDRGLADAVPAVAAALARTGGVVHEREPGEPTVDAVDATAAALGEAGADAVVAIGGGSTMDTAKGARLVHGQGAPYSRFAAGELAVESPGLPLVCIPTTAGTGSEVSGGAVITDADTHRKAGIADPLLRAQHALVDPELTYGLPPATTAHTGIDALAQAIAAVAVRVHTPVGDAIALEAARLAAQALPAVVRDGSDHGARAQMMCASLMAGLAMNIADCGSEHSLGQAIGGRYGLPHGLTIGLVLAETMERDRAAAPERFERIADALGEPGDGSGDGSRAVRAVRRLLAELDFPTLAAAGIEAAAVDELAHAALEDYFISVAPRDWSRDDARDALREGLALGASR